jgi:ACR3 family arsenite efflux pump ArsB
MAALIWVMIYPMMVQIDFQRCADVGTKGLANLDYKPAD